MPKLEKAMQVSKCLELAILFEVTSNKPGNVNLVVGFEGTKVEHFLASAVAASSSFRKAAKHGMEISNGYLRVQRAETGRLMKECVADIDAWQTGGNTLLGTVMLFIPLAVAAGMTPMNGKGEFDLSLLRKNMKLIAETTTPQDAVNLYEAIEIAKPSGLNAAPDLDVKAAESKVRLLKENVNLYKVFQIGSSYDDICYEWTNNFSITFDIAYPYLREQLKTKSLNTAIIHTFLKVLSERPDTFISRKVGLEKTIEISKEAGKVFHLGGVDTSEGREGILMFDKKLRESGNDYNPGTTADITAATLALCILNGYRP
jgi:triphosphoribosyl-dephospho-CoA synthase